MDILSEKLYTQVANGKSADVVLSQLAPIWRAQADSIIAQLKSDHRLGRFDLIQTQSRIAQLCVLEDMEMTLRKQITAADRAAVTIKSKGDKT